MLVSIYHLIIVALAGICAWLAGKWFFKKDTEVENRRRAAGHLAAELKALGFRELPEYFIDYSVGDYSSMLHKLAELARIFMAGEAAVLTELDDVFVKLLDIKLKTDDGRKFVRIKLEAAERLVTQVVLDAKSEAKSGVTV